MMEAICNGEKAWVEAIGNPREDWGAGLGQSDLWSSALPVASNLVIVSHSQGTAPVLLCTAHPRLGLHCALMMREEVGVSTIRLLFRVLEKTMGNLSAGTWM